MKVTPPSVNPLRPGLYATGSRIFTSDAARRCDVALCGVDNNPGRIAASTYFRRLRIPVIFTAVSADTDHGYVFIQEPTGPCFGCLFPDAVDDQTNYLEFCIREKSKSSLNYRSDVDRCFGVS